MSIPTPSLPPFGFIVDTNAYAGNFERELCAYVTGRTGECGVGAEQAEKFADDHPELVETMDELVTGHVDDHGVSRPCAIWPTPGRYNDGKGKHYDGELTHGRCPAYESVIIFLNEKPSPEIAKLFRERAEHFSKNPVRDWSRFKIKAMRFIAMQVTTVETPLDL